MNMFFQKLNIPDPIWNLNSVYIPEAPSFPIVQKYEKKYENVDEIVPSDLLNTLQKVDLVPHYVRIFVWPRNFWGQWHIDGDVESARYSCMNWLLKGSGIIQFNGNVSLKMVEGIHRGEGKMSHSNDYFEDETNGHGCVINSGYCHRVVTGLEGRTSISLSYSKLGPKFPEMIEKLKQINLI